MRKHLALITDHDNEDLVGTVKITDQQLPRVRKDEDRTVDTVNVETNERGSYDAVGLGYHDFEDEQHYQETIGGVVSAKLRDIDTEHLKKAGVSLDDKDE